MSVMIDIISSVVVGSILLLIAIVTTNNGTQELVNYNAARLTQMDLAQTVYILESDLGKLGFGISETDREDVLQSAQGNHLKFLAHLNQSADTQMPVAGVTTYDNIPDTIEYTIALDESIDFGDTTVYLYNVQRAVKIASLANTTATIGKIGNANAFTFLDQVGNPAGVNAEIRMLEISLSAFNPKVVLSAELFPGDEGVISAEEQTANAELRKREVRRILRGSYWQNNRFILRNLNN